MAVNDVTVTPANVSMRSDTVTDTVQFGEAISAGDIVYRKASDSKYYQADADLSDEASGKEGIGIAVSDGATDEYGVIATGGSIDIGGTLTKGEVYILSDTAATITLAEDVASNWYTTIIGVASSTSELELLLEYTGIKV